MQKVFLTNYAMLIDFEGKILNEEFIIYNFGVNISGSGNKFITFTHDTGCVTTRQGHGSPSRFENPL